MLVDDKQAREKMGPTPRTDALGDQPMTIGDITPPFPVLAKWESLARQLEREVESLSAQVAELQRIKHLAWHVLESSEERVQEDEIVVDRGDFEALSEALPEGHHELTAPAKREYDVIADAVNEVAEAAQEAFRKAGIEPGEWDSDDIVKDVSRGIADCVESLGAQVAELQNKDDTKFADAYARGVFDGKKMQKLVPVHRECQRRFTADAHKIANLGGEVNRLTLSRGNAAEVLDSIRALLRGERHPDDADKIVEMINGFLHE